MNIYNYLDILGVDGKKFVLLAISPKEMYPEKYGEKFELFVQNVMNQEDKFIPLFDNERKEIVQDVAFKLFTVPLIADSYSMIQKKLTKQPRAKKEQVEAFCVLKEFYDNVPSGQLKEDEAIKKGLEKANDFINKYPMNEHDIVLTVADRHEHSVEILRHIDFESKNGYHFDYRYCY